MNKIWNEVRAVYDELKGLPQGNDIVSIVCIDAFCTADLEELGEVIAKVIRTKTGDVGVVYINDLARYDTTAQVVILKALSEQYIAARKENRKAINLVLELGKPYYQIEKVSRKEPRTCEYCDGAGVLLTKSGREQVCAWCGGSRTCNYSAGMVWVVRDAVCVLDKVAKYSNDHNPTCYYFAFEDGTSISPSVQENTTAYGYPVISNYFPTREEALAECEKRNAADVAAANDEQQGHICKI